MNPLIRKLSAFVDFDDGDRRALVALCDRSERMASGTQLIAEGDRPESVRLLLDGWACRHKDMADGTRQIIAVLLPGDLCDVHIFILKQMDHSISLLSDATVARIPKERMLEVMSERPRIATAFWWSTLVDEAILREWLVNLGSRDARRGLAHLFMELFVRLRQVGQTEADSFALPMTQIELAETFGLTTVHLNRMLQQLRGDDLIRLEGRRLTILDMERLTDMAGFTPNYLHLERR